MNKTELHIEIAPSDLSYAPAIARFQAGMSEYHYLMYEVEVQ